MKTVHIPLLARDVSCLGMGSMVFSPERRELVFELLDAFRERGGNLIDTAKVYGEAEAAIALYLKERGCRSDLVILDKDLEQCEAVAPENIAPAVAGNLERLGTDYIDLWVMHRDNPAVPVGELVDALNREVTKGAIRAFGGSNWPAQRIAEANDYAAKKGLMGMAVSSPNVCLATPKEPFWQDCTHATQEDLAWYARADVPVISWSSQGRGFFLDTSGPDDTSGDLARVFHNETNFARLGRAREMAKAKGVQPIQIALAYVLNLPVPIVALAGPATLQELDSCVRGAELQLTQDEVAWLRDG